MNVVGFFFSFLKRHVIVRLCLNKGVLCRGVGVQLPFFFIKMISKLVKKNGWLLGKT